MDYSHEAKTVRGAIVLIHEVSDALDRGVKHYCPVTGEELTNVAAVLNCLVENGGVELKPKPDE